MSVWCEYRSTFQGNVFAIGLQHQTWRLSERTMMHVPPSFHAVHFLSLFFTRGQHGTA